MEQYLEKIRPNLGNIMDDLRASGQQKIHLTMKINFMSLKDNGESHSMHSKSDNIDNVFTKNT